ncbi:hypothetical protein [Dyella sp.]|uniref:hypothetical protein n=1 Tax=Dyella sp. TaxID=1869338 RepID=UPI002B490213|nr:hypothetical protein [Dyella sp.]HKT29290.1 hypothetical protein [Dyella sp.]
MLKHTAFARRKKKRTNPGKVGDAFTNLRAQDLPDRPSSSAASSPFTPPAYVKTLHFSASPTQILAPYFCNASNISPHKSWDW